MDAHQQREALLRDYMRAVQEVFRASKSLSDLAGKCSLSDYTVLLHERDRAIAHASRARSEFERFSTRTIAGATSTSLP